MPVFRGSHTGPIYSMYDQDGHFVVRVSDADMAGLDNQIVDQAIGGPGTTILLNCRTVHGSAPNRAARARPLLLPVYSSADAFAYTPSPITSPRQGDIVRGRPATLASFDTRPCELPPDWRGGYRTAWTYQKEEETRGQPARAVGD